MGDHTGGSSSGSDGDASGTPLAAAAAAAATGEATGSGSSRALSAEALPFHPPFVTTPLPPAFHPRQPPFLFGPTAPGQHFAASGHQLAFNPAAAMGRGSAFPSNWPVGNPAAASVYSGPGSRPPLQGRHGPSSPGLGRQCPPAHPAHGTVASGEDQTAKVDNMRLPLRRRAYVPPSSLSLGPRSQSTSSASGAGIPKLSYSAMTRHGSDTMVEMNKWKCKMINYLKRDDCSHYKRQASTAGVKLEMQFEDILVKDKELAVQLCNSQGVNEFCLHQATKDFFTETGVPTARASFLLKDMPCRLTKVCNKANTIEVATVHGRRTLETVICGLLDKIGKGESWCGDIKIEDLMLAEDATGGKKLIITKESVVKENATDGERLDDLWVSLIYGQYG